jgi:anti-sigma regulatory factor (Ser/Thr protein kinase)
MSSSDSSYTEATVVRVADLHYLALSALPQALAPLRRALSHWAVGTGLGTSRIEDLVLSVDEAVTNVVEHAYLDGPGELALLAAFRPDPARVEVTVTDQGRWRDGGGPFGGRGLMLIDRLTDSSDVQSGDNGTTVLMTWFLLSPELPGAVVSPVLP